MQTIQVKKPENLYKHEAKSLPDSTTENAKKICLNVTKLWIYNQAGGKEHNYSEESNNAQKFKLVPEPAFPRGALTDFSWSRI